MIKQQKILTKLAKETRKFAAEFAKTLKGGEVLGLIGELGSGKTTFVQGLACGLGIKKRILSPTFVLIREHPVRVRGKSKGNSFKPFTQTSYFFHIDLYRIEAPNDVQTLGLEEIWSNPENIVAIEWAERIEEILPQKTIKIYFEHINKTTRRIHIAPPQKAKP